MCNLFHNARAKRWLDRYHEETKPKKEEEEKKSFREIIKDALGSTDEVLPKELMEKLNEYITKQEEDPVTDEEPQAQDESSDN